MSIPQAYHRAQLFHTAKMERLKSIMGVVNLTLLAALIVSTIYLIQDGRGAILVLRDEGQNTMIALRGQSSDAVKRAGRVERVISEPFNEFHHFLKGDGRFKETGLPSVTLSMMSNTNKLGGAAEELGKTAKAGTVTLNAATGTLRQATKTFATLNTTFLKANTLLDSKELKGGIENFSLIASNVEGISSKLNAALDPKDKESFAHKIYVSGDDVNSMTTDMKFWVKRQTKKPRLITTIAQKIFDVGYKAALVVK